MDLKKDNTPEFNANQINTAVRYFTHIYYKSLENDQLETGTIMQGNSSIDMSLCMDLYKN